MSVYIGGKLQEILDELNPIVQNPSKSRRTSSKRYSEEKSNKDKYEDYKKKQATLEFIKKKSGNRRAKSLQRPKKVPHHLYPGTQVFPEFSDKKVADNKENQLKKSDIKYSLRIKRSSKSPGSKFFKFNEQKFQKIKDKQFNFFLKKGKEKKRISYDIQEQIKNDLSIGFVAQQNLVKDAVITTNHQKHDSSTISEHSKKVITILPNRGNSSRSSNSSGDIIDRYSRIIKSSFLNRDTTYVPSMKSRHFESRKAMRTDTQNLLGSMLTERIKLEQGRVDTVCKYLLKTLQVFSSEHSEYQPIFQMLLKPSKSVLLLSSHSQMVHLQRTLEEVGTLTNSFKLLDKENKSISDSLQKEKPQKLYLNQPLREVTEVLLDSLETLREKKIEFETKLKNHTNHTQEIAIELTKKNDSLTDDFASYLKNIEGAFKQRYSKLEKEKKDALQKISDLKKETGVLKTIMLKSETMKDQAFKSEINSLQHDMIEKAKKMEDITSKWNLKIIEIEELRDKVAKLKLNLDLNNRYLDDKKRQISSMRETIQIFEQEQSGFTKLKQLSTNPKMMKIAEFFGFMTKLEKKKFNDLSFFQQTKLIMKRKKAFFFEIVEILQDNKRVKIRYLISTLKTLT